jgi:hypothetical protein
MVSTAFPDSPPREAATAGDSAIGVPWFVWLSVVAVTSAMVGGHWDISWHRSIGRDGFWTAPHIAIYMCGVLAGVSSGYLVLATTLGKRDDGGASVRMWGFRGPLGAFIAAWGGVAMLTSAPFDNWWHNAYGLDVKIISPPHALLMLGMFAVQLGSLVLILAFMNRADGAERRRLGALFLYVGGMLVIALTVFLMERTDRSDMHSAEFYRDLSLALPLVLVGVSRAAPQRWACTIMATIYSLFQIGLILILPLFPAEPKLGPVYFKVTHFVPPDFPLLLIAPAIALDLLRRMSPRLGVWRETIATGVLFLATLFIVQWPFADFLMSPWSRNRFFATIYFGYYERPTWNNVRGEFSPSGSPAQFAVGLLIALALALVMSRLGLMLGDWMKRIKR